MLVRLGSERRFVLAIRSCVQAARSPALPPMIPAHLDAGDMESEHQRRQPAVVLRGAALHAKCPTTSSRAARPSSVRRRVPRPQTKPVDAPSAQDVLVYVASFKAREPGPRAAATAPLKFIGWVAGDKGVEDGVPKVPSSVLGMSAVELARRTQNALPNWSASQRATGWTCRFPQVV